ncbi:MAG: pirin family protein [Pyrinomonadaceae bacterium]|nr:pirin family protein [Pyrinomonadaceae bacterium]
MKEVRRIAEIITPETTSDGAGVTLKRGLGTAKLNYLDPFLLFDHFGSSNPDEYIAGFPMHPHRGIETVTYMLKGLIKHKDSSGNEGVLGEGDVQWMTAGSGIMHEEMPQMEEGKMEGFQLWVNLPAKNKMMRPRYQEFKSAEVPVVTAKDGAVIKVLAGEVDETKGLVKDIEANPTYIDVTLEGGVDFAKSIPKGHSVFAYVFEGAAEFGGNDTDEATLVEAPRLVVFKDGDLVKIKASERVARFLLVSGQPLGEPIARYGPFVMNTREEIQQALTDLQTGAFVKSYE